MIQKGTFPASGRIDFELNKVQLGILEKGLINFFKMDAIVSHPDQPLLGKRKLKLKILYVHTPGSITIKTKGVRNESNIFSKETSSGLARTHEYLIDSILSPNSWILFGTVEGSKSISIVICFFVDLNLGTYALKKDNESEKDFNPQMN